MRRVYWNMIITLVQGIAAYLFPEYYFRLFLEIFGCAGFGELALMVLGVQKVTLYLY